ncbi:hypothetical protein CNR27_07285 [Luteimonas chenhongjianii]|uniref:Uncharacterized protein n=1 Tax=Luteimonas chenhongjianii TaxID=2006110 RepID=A0A290XEA1_9GAMM|nr:hypothetical protein [Luteimonas chenhongjianii]ATD67266.1 hypothetical protein CNR27_07285 [Luteimonas chenhongjianii]
MKLFASLTLSLAVVIGAGAASAQQVRFPSDAHAIRGLGEAVPAAPSISQSPNFRVYEFEKDGVRYVQINTLDDEVLTAVGITKSGAFVLPIGSLSREEVRVASRGAAATATRADGNCPCSAEVVFRDAHVTIVVVYGTGGQVIEVVVIYHEVPR